MRTQRGGWWCGALSVLFLLLTSAAVAEACTTVDISGGDYPGRYEFDSTTTSYSFSEERYILQTVNFADDRRGRRRLTAPVEDGVASGGGENALFSGGGRRLSDDEPCETQMWILMDNDVVVDGYPYYAAFDCAEHPADVTSTWLYVECSDCEEMSDVSVVCPVETIGTLTESSGDGGFFTVPVIAGIAAGGALFCLILACCAWKCRRSPKGNNSFADDSDHSVSQKQAMAGDTGAAVGPDGRMGGMRSGSVALVGAGAVGAGQPGNRAVLKGAHAAPMQVRSGMTMNNSSFREGHEGSGYDGMFAPPAPHSASSNAMVMKDSMAAAAAAAAARSSALSNNDRTSSSVSGGGSQAQQYRRSRPPSHPATVGFVEDGNSSVPRHSGAPGEGNIVWSAGQNYVVDHEASGRHIATSDSYHGRAGGGARQRPDNYDDSAAGSEFSLNPDNVPDRSYYDDASVPTSSPGGYSMYSHFTAGGHTIFGDGDNVPASSRYGAIPNDQSMYSGDGSELSWSGEGDGNPLRASRAQPTFGGSGSDPHAHPLQPLPTLEPVIAPDSPIAQALQQQQQIRRGGSKEHVRMRSPAGLVARADRAATRSSDGSRRGSGDGRDDGSRR